MVSKINEAIPSVKLNSGYYMPMIGLGSGRPNKDLENAQQSIKSAIVDSGYRMIDTATIYETEETIGTVLQEVFAEGKIKREDLFITTKIWPANKDSVEATLRSSLKKLKLDYLDLYLIHWMTPQIDWSDPQNLKFTPIPTHVVWAEMERMVSLGLVRSLGVSNCGIQMLMDMMAYGTTKPAVNQIELHPYLVQKELVEFHKKCGVVLEAYGPLTVPTWTKRKEEYKDLNILNDPVILELSSKYQKTPAQIILNWHLWRGHVVIPSSFNKERQVENINCYDFKLSEEDYERISALDKGARLYDPKYYNEYERDYYPYFD